MSDTQVTEVPTTIRFTDEDYSRVDQKKELRDGWMKFRVRGAKCQTAKTGSLQVNLTCNPVDAEGNLRGPSIYNNLTVPLANTAVEGHKAPDTFGFWHDYLNAVDPETYPRYPKWNAEMGQYVDASGETLTKAQAETRKKEIRLAIGSAIEARWADPQLFVDDEFYGLVFTKPSADGGRSYKNLKRVSETAPADAEVITENFTATDAE